MKNHLLLLLCVFSLTAVAQDSLLEAPKIAIRMHVGETIQLKGNRITFLAVTEDSRCPKNVNCIWAGRAIVLLKITDVSGMTSEKSIIIGQTKPNESKTKVLLEKEDYSFEAIALTPYPVYEEEMAPYTLLISEKKVD